ncbi:MAG: Glycosyltransferase [Candidatus Saccharicenans subterraneus]|uniref:Glycosyltransferase n=1 Tax=Candidatus Saccharicenans subterraneus TaxID=2508984 RepID=A0A3E2BKC6_9BACT|nr:MAG: Glycosyltransferase [Candidatus Saccharicenans subterraneum]
MTLLNYLDEITIFRFGQIYKSGGGIEEHINNVDRLLLSRNKLTILRTFIDSKATPLEPMVEYSEKGKIVWIPIEPLSGGRSVDLNPFLRLFFPRADNFLTKSMIEIINKILSFFPNRLYFLKFNYRELDKLVQRIYQKYPFDLAVIHTIFGLDEVVIINELRKIGVPIIIIYHFDAHRLKHPLLKRIAKKATEIAVINSGSLSRLLKNRIFKIVEGVDSNFWDLNLAQTQLSMPQHKLILLPARIHPSKGQMDALKTLGMLRKQGINAILVFAGRIDSQSYYKEILKFVKIQKFDNQVINLGELNKEELRNWYAAADIVVLPSYSEGLGRSLLEAQLMKRPVVAYNSGGISEAVINGVTGFLVKTGNIEELSLRLKQLLSDEILCKQMGERGRSFVINEFSLQKMVRSHEDLYIKTLMSWKQ